ncbi:MAG: hypothetical protein LQ351_000749 [Letrouitia transgressa]|nr:MAG: hypothetical protein LQ351_000749 [Letrouitia transgressa]
MAGRKDFLNQPAPENYVAGLGRGATGFTTRSDLGPAREGPSEDQIKEALAKRAQQLGAAPPTAYGATERKEEDNDDDDRFQDPENEVGLFANGTFDREDDEADRIYQEVDERMGRRRKQQRQAREIQERKDYDDNNPKISQQFADLKRSLGSIKDEDWASIPEVGDLTGRNRRARQNLRQRFYAVPDSVIAGARDSTQFDTSVNDDGTQTNGAEPDSMDGTMTNFADIGAARDKVLKVRLDRAARGSGTDSASGSATNIDPKGYLTSLSESEIKAGAVEVGDLRRVRGLLESVIKTNPKHAPGWIAASRLELVAGKEQAARNIIARGCQTTPDSEAVWVENIRMNENHNAKIIAANAIKHIPQSTRLWMLAADLETDLNSKKRVLRRAIDMMPTSTQIWKELVNLCDDPADARLLLDKATKEIPLATELWLALARLETHDNAQKVLNKARLTIPTSFEIWIAAARLQEQTGGKPELVMGRAVQGLARENAMLKREEWIAEAEKCESEDALLTCEAIVHQTLGYGLVEDDDRNDLWVEDAKGSIGRGMYCTARAIFQHILRVFPNSTNGWHEAVDLEKILGDKQRYEELLKKAVEALPNAEDLWLMLARERRESGDIEASRKTFATAFRNNPTSENIYLSAIKFEAEYGEIDVARSHLRTAREKSGTDRVWWKSVAFEREQKNNQVALDLVIQGLEMFPNADKLWMQKGQIYEAERKLPQAREAYSTGTRVCPHSVPLWLLLSRLEEQKAGSLVKARSVLDRARLANLHNDLLALETIRLERRAGDLTQAKNLMAKFQHDMPRSGILWSERILFLEPRTQRKPLSLAGVKAVENDPTLFVAVARVFWGERKLEKAASWFEKAIVLDSDLGDTWAWYYKFLLQHGKDDKRADVLGKIQVNEPKHGEMWQAVAKDPAMARKTPEQVLLKVVESLENAN